MFELQKKTSNELNVEICLCQEQFLKNWFSRIRAINWWPRAQGRLWVHPGPSLFFDFSKSRGSKTRFFKKPSEFKPEKNFRRKNPHNLNDFFKNFESRGGRGGQQGRLRRACSRHEGSRFAKFESISLTRDHDSRKP